MEELSKLQAVFLAILSAVPAVLIWFLFMALAGAWQ